MKGREAPAAGVGELTAGFPVERCAGAGIEGGGVNGADVGERVKFACVCVWGGGQEPGDQKTHHESIFPKQFRRSLVK